MPLSAEDSRQLHKDMLEYLTKGSRIMSANKLSIWNDFAASFDFQYSDYAHEELHREFLQTILPKVFTYDLTVIQKRKVEIFATHYQFKSCEQGFHEISSRINTATEGKEFITPETQVQVACIVHHVESVHEIPSPNPLFSALVSAVVSDDYELANFRVFRGISLRKRYQRARDHFKETGLFPENLTPAIGKKIISFRTQAEKMSLKLRVGPY